MAGSMVYYASSDTFDPDPATDKDIIEACTGASGQSKDIVMALKEQIVHENAKVQLRALNLLETVMENCGDMVHRHVAEADVLLEMVQIVKKKSDPGVEKKVLALIETWQGTLGGPHPRYSQYNAAYNELLHAGAEFPRRLENPPPPFNVESQATDMGIPDLKGEAETSAANDCPALRPDMVLPGPHITIVIDEESTDPFQDKAEEIRSWLADHDDKEVLLDGEHANEETIEDFDELKKLGPHQFLERQMRKLPPLRWLHLRLELKREPEFWFGLVFRADNFYMKGFTSRPNGGALTCYEITEEQKEKRTDIRNRPRLFPPEFNAVHLPWDLKYYELLGLERRDGETIFEKLMEMRDDPTFITTTIKYFSFLDPAVCDPIEARRRLAGVIFRLCEPVRMRLTVGTGIPFLKDYVWGWTDICNGLRRWKDDGFKGWNEIKDLGDKTPRDVLEVIILVLNRSHGSILYAQTLRTITVKKGHKPKDTPKKHAHRRSGAAKKDDNTASGSSSNKGGCSGSNVPFSRSRIQILGVRANFKIDDINIYDAHRGQKIYMNDYGYVENTSLVLCGPSRPIGAFGYMAMEIFPTSPESEPILAYSDVSNSVDAEAALYEEVVYAGTDQTDQRLFFSYLHIPNAIEAKIQVLLHSDEDCLVSGFLKATATSYEDNYVNIFVMENDEKLSIPKGEWTTVPLLVDVICLPFKRDVEIKVDVDLIVAQPGGRPHGLRRILTFTNEYEKQEIKIHANKTMEVIVSMRPDPSALADVVVG